MLAKVAGLAVGLALLGAAVDAWLDHGRRAGVWLVPVWYRRGWGWWWVGIERREEADGD